MAEKQNIPEIRFEGFTDPWEQRKFADFVTASGIRNSENLDLPSYSVTNDRGFVPQDEQFENGGTMREADKTSYWIVEPNSFAYNPARINVGSIGYQSTGGNVIVSSLYEVFRTDETCDDHFLWHWFKTRLFTQQIEMLQEGGVRLYFFFDKLLKSGISMPSVDEQRLIGEQFDWLDSLITLHQRKYDKLCTVKKSMLDKMFPKPGETEPEIRFEGFTDPWEQRKLGNCGTTYGGLSGKTKEDFGHGNARFVPYTNVFDNPLTDTKRLETVEIDSSQNKVAYGDTFFTVSSETPDEVGMSSVWLSDQDDVYLNSFCFGYRQDSTFDPHYLAYMLRSSSIRSDLTLLAQGISRFNISKNKVMELSVPVPSAAEQKQIGQYFARLDSLITLHQRKLELLRNIKKSLLDRMFV